MAKIELATPFDEMSGKLSSTERIVMRTRYGRTHAYAIRHPFREPFSENQKTVINAFYQAARQCKIEVQDPERLAFWQEQYTQYTKLAKRNTVKANMQFVGTKTDKFYLTLRGFIIAVLSTQLRPSPLAPSLSPFIPPRLLAVFSSPARSKNFAFPCPLFILHFGCILAPRSASRKTTSIVADTIRFSSFSAQNKNFENKNTSNACKLHFFLAHVKKKQ